MLARACRHSHQRASRPRRPSRRARHCSRRLWRGPRSARRRADGVSYRGYSVASSPDWQTQGVAPPPRRQRVRDAGGGSCPHAGPASSSRQRSQRVHIRSASGVSLCYFAAKLALRPLYPRPRRGRTSRGELCAQAARMADSIILPQLCRTAQRAGERSPFHFEPILAPTVARQVGTLFCVLQSCGAYRPDMTLIGTGFKSAVAKHPPRLVSYHPAEA